MNGISRSVPLFALAIAVALVVGCAPSARRTEWPDLAVSVLNAAASANEIELISGTGRRVRIDPHPPLPMDGHWSPDGKQIAFSGRGDNAARGLYVMNAQGTKVRLLFAPATPSNDDFSPYWSPDGRKLAFVVDGLGPWIVAADGGRPHRLADIPMDSYTAPIAWSPDGRALAFGSSKNGALYTIRTDGTRLRRLTPKLPNVDEGEEVGSAAWSPDGRRIAFVQYPLTNSLPLIKVLSPTGGRARSLARGDFLAWSPDARRLAFIAPVGIGVVGAGGGSARVVANPPGFEGPPAWTTDGSRIVFGSFPSRRFYVADARRGRPRPSHAERMHLQVVPVSSQYWSANGKFLAADGDITQRSANPVGAEPAHGDAVVRILTASGVAATFRWSTDDTPAWAPDGNRLAFVRSARTKTIYVISARGGRARALVPGHNPVWSPDGKSIAFERRGAIFVIPAAGGHARRIGPGHNPAWSPDSRSLAFDHLGVFTEPVEGGLPRQIAMPHTEECDADGPVRLVPARPFWSHNGRFIAFDNGNDDCPAFDVVASDGAPRWGWPNGEKPQWTPGDSKLVFLDFNERLIAIAATGKDQRVVSDHDFVMSFSITSDGRLIAYSRWPCTRTACTNEIWVTRTDGRERWPVLTGSIDTDPAWRPR